MSRRSRQPQKCKFCEGEAEKSLIWADGRAYVPVCSAHEGYARRKLREQGLSILDTVAVEKRRMGYREGFHPNARMESALEEAPDFAYCDDEPGTHFGRRVSPDARESALAEAPRREPLPIAPIGRRSAPRGSIFKQRTGRDVMGISTKPLTRKTTDIRTRTVAPTTTISGKQIPDSMLQMLGTDWKTLRATKVHDNRMTVTIDGVRFSLYTRRG